MKYLIDSSIIITYLLNNDKDLYKKARDFFDLLKMGKVRAHIEQATFIETVIALSSLYNVSNEEINKTLSNLLMIKGIISDYKDVLIKALELYANNELPIIDCIIAAKGIHDQIVVKTFSNELKTITEVTHE